MQLFIPIIDTRFAPQILPAQWVLGGAGQSARNSIINWVISYKNVVITLERSGDKQDLTLHSAELLIQFAHKDCFSFSVDSLFSAGGSFSLLFKAWAAELVNAKCSANS